MMPYLLTFVTSDLREKYSENRNRCVKSFLDNGFEGEVFVGSDIIRPEWPKIKYIFKAYCIREAIRHRARHLIWSDSPMVLLKPYQYLESLIKEYRVFLPKNGRHDIWWSLGQWSNDATLEYFNITREQAFDIPLVVSGFMGFDVYQEITRSIINDFFAASNTAGLAEGPRYMPNQPIVLSNRNFLGVRPDQCIMSILAYKYNIPIIEYVYADPTNAVGLPCDLSVTDKTVVASYPKGTKI